jgi:pantoate--beta-alanine ligase
MKVTFNMNATQRLTTIEELKTWRNLQTGSVGFVPTMGALHAGHRYLIEKSVAENTHTLVSVFVNPLQFNDSMDFQKYPRTEEDDFKFISDCRASVAFFPTVEDIYPKGNSIRVHEVQDSLELEGKFRPGHFEGMLTVVLKLLMLTQPQRVYFGEKDFQQVLLVQKMVKELFLDVEVIPCQTQRDPRGLALSSRNRRVSEADRTYLSQVFSLLQSSSNLESIEKSLKGLGIEVEYLAEKWDRRLVAYSYKGVRFIDNVETIR